MSWAIGFNKEQDRDVGYSVIAICDHPGCTAEITRGIGYVCCENINHRVSCGAFLCEEHRENYVYGDEVEDLDPEDLEALNIDVDDPEVQEAIEDGEIVACKHEHIEDKKEHAGWLDHCLTDATWETWRQENPKKVQEYKAALNKRQGNVCFVLAIDSEVTE